MSRPLLNSATRRRVAIALLASASVCAPVAAQQANPAQPPQPYYLYCRGGAGIRTSMTVVRAEQSGYEHATGLFRFSRGEHAAGPRGENLEPGTCAWINRGMLPSEPTLIVFEGISYHIFVSLESQRIEFVADPFVDLMNGVHAIDVASGDEQYESRGVHSIDGTNAPPSRPAETTFKSDVPLVRRGVKNSLQVSVDGRDWSDGGGILTSDPSVAALSATSAIVAARGQDGGVWVTTCEKTSCTGWTSLGGNISGQPVIKSSGDGFVQVSATGQDGSLLTNTREAKGTWTGWRSTK